MELPVPVFGSDVLINEDSHVKVTKLAPTMGAEITGINLSSSDFSDNIIGEMRAVWLEHNVIVLRDQNLTPQQQLKLARAFGEPAIYPFLEGVEDIPGITAVLKREHETVNFGGVWHTDTSYQDKPPMATMLQAIKVPPIHPVVWTHPETGRKSLYFSPGHATSFEGWTEEESVGLLDCLSQHQIAPEFQCRLAWGVGDIAIWDNRSTLHYPLNDYHGHWRLLHRITLKGNKPV